MKFVQIKSGEELNWALFIDNEKDFNRFLKDRAKQLYKTYKMAKEHVKIYGDLSHSTILAYVFGMELEKHNNDRKNAFDDLNILENTFLSVYKNIFNRDNELLVWQSTNKWHKEKYAGCMSFKMLKNSPIKFEIVKTIEKNRLEFPTKKEIDVYTKNKINVYTEKNISINKWPGGSHFYAKVGDKDVVVDDNVKWNTYESAMRNAKIFLKELNN